MPKILAALSAIGLSACSVVGIRSEEEPEYRVVSEVGPAEIREYAPCIAAETIVPGGEYAARSTGFRRLAHYIFGGNRAQRSIAMTAPVATAPVAASSQTISMTAPVVQARDDAGRWLVRFIMPPEFTLQTLPIPNDPQVRLVALPAATFAALRFSGSIAPDAIAARRQALLKALSGSAWRSDGEPMAWFYDPPWTLPFLRRNEVAVAVANP